jgi:DNA-binding XRE family transcriptional regulator
LGAKIQISLAAARVNARLTQDDVAKTLHITKQTIVNWEKGATEPSINQGRILEKLYGIPMDYIFLPSKSN